MKITSQRFDPPIPLWQAIAEARTDESSVNELEQRLLQTKDPLEKRRLLKELQELTAKETRAY